MKYNEVEKLLDPANNYEHMTKCLSQLQADGETPYIPLIAPNVSFCFIFYFKESSLTPSSDRIIIIFILAPRIEIFI